MFVEDLHKEYWTARSLFLDEKISLEIFNDQTEGVVNTINNAYRRVLTGATSFAPLGAAEIDPTLIVGAAISPLKADPSDKETAPTLAIIGKENAAESMSLAESSVATFRRAHNLLIRQGKDEKQSLWLTAEPQFNDANRAFFEFAQAMVNIMAEVHRPTRRSQLEDQIDGEKCGLQGAKGMLDLYEAGERMYSITSLGLPRTVLHKLAERAVTALADETVAVTVGYWTDEHFVDDRDWPILRSVARTLIAAFWRCHLPVVTPGSGWRDNSHSTFRRMLKIWQHHLRKQAQLTSKLEIEAVQKAEEQFYLKLSTQPREPEVDVYPLSDELDRGDVLYLPAPGPFETSQVPEVQQ